METSDWAASVIAICAVVVAASAAYIAWLQYRSSVEAGVINFEFHHAWARNTGDERWIAFTCRSASAYVHGVATPDGYAEAEFGTHLSGDSLARESGPGPMSFGGVKFVRVHNIRDDDGFYVDVLASVDARGIKRTISSPWISSNRDAEKQ